MKELEKKKDHLQMKRMLYTFCKLTSDGNDFPELNIIALQNDVIQEAILDQALDDKNLCNKAISIFKQLNIIFERFAKENNIKYDDLSKM